MKRLITAALAASLLIPGSWALKARAQDDDHGMAEHHEMAEDAPEHHEMGEKAVAKMKERLGLTDDQAAKLKDAMKAHGEAVKPLFEKMKSGMKTLREQVKSKAADADVKKTLDDLKSNRAAMGAENEKFHAALESFLSPTQQAKMVLGMAHRMRERMGGRERGMRREKGDRKGPPPSEKGGDKDGR